MKTPLRIFAILAAAAVIAAPTILYAGDARDSMGDPARWSQPIETPRQMYENMGEWRDKSAADPEFDFEVWQFVRAATLAAKAAGHDNFTDLADLEWRGCGGLSGSLRGRRARRRFPGKCGCRDGRQNNSVSV